MNTFSSLPACVSVFAMCFAVVAAVAEPALDVAGMDPRISPRDDFYQYVNGGWLAKNPIPPEFTSWGAFTELDERNRVTLHEILEGLSRPEGNEKAEPGSIERKLGDFYASGMDEAAIDREGTDSLKGELSRIEEIQDKAGFASEIAKLHGEGVAALFDLDGDQD